MKGDVAEGNRPPGPFAWDKGEYLLDCRFYKR